MRNLDAVQAGLRLTRDALTPLVTRTLQAEYGDGWWQKGVLEALTADGKPITDRPVQGDGGDIDLQLALKLVQVYHWELFSDTLDWGGRQRSLLAAVTGVRNQYEGHVTPNREAELTGEKTRVLLEGMESLLLLFDKKAGRKMGDLIEKWKAELTEPEPEPEEEEDEPEILRPARPRRGDPGRITPPVAVERPKGIFPAHTPSLSREQAQALRQRREAAPPVRSEAPAPGSFTQSEPSSPGEQDFAPPAAKKNKAPSGPPVGRREALPKTPPMAEPAEESPPELGRTQPIEKPAAARKLAPAREPEPKKPREPLEAPDPQPITPGQRVISRPKAAPPQRPDPDLYAPAPIPRRTPRRQQRPAYEVDIRAKETKRGRNLSVKPVPPPPAPERAARKKPDARVLRRVIGYGILAIALAALLILLDRALAVRFG